MQLKLPETTPAKAIYCATLPTGGQGTLGNLHTTHTTMTLCGREARCQRANPGSPGGFYAEEVPKTAQGEGKKFYCLFFSSIFFLLPSARHLKERLTVSQSVSQSGKQSVRQSVGQAGRQAETHSLPFFAVAEYIYKQRGTTGAPELSAIER